MEKILQYIWQWRLYDSADKTLVDDRRVCIIDPGRLNPDAGPDFFNAKIRIGDTEWVGNVEIHVRASDWYRHSHDRDEAYDNVVLHVVQISDTEITTRHGEKLPQLKLEISDGLKERYETLMSMTSGIRCGHFLPTMSQLDMTDWLETLGFERMVQKRRIVEDILERNNGDWATACFVILSRSLGFNLNADPFERVARSLPLSVTARHCDNRMQLEALLMGQAGLLDGSETSGDEYYDQLCGEYKFLAIKYSLRPLSKDVWKLARTRPANFPHRRLALMAILLADGHKIWSRLLEAKGDLHKIEELLSLRFTGYWSYHYRFGEASARPTELALGRSMVRVAIINAVVPLYYAYGVLTGDTQYEELAFELLEQMPAESNTIIRSWSALGIPADNAFRSQALIQLRKRYCDERKCLDCRIGLRMMRRRETK